MTSIKTPLSAEDLAALLAPLLRAYDAGESLSSISRRTGTDRRAITALMRLSGRVPREGVPPVTTWCPSDQVVVYQKLRRYLGATAARAEIERARACS